MTTGTALNDLPSLSDEEMGALEDPYTVIPGLMDEAAIERRNRASTLDPPDYSARSIDDESIWLLDNAQALRDYYDELRPPCTFEEFCGQQYDTAWEEAVTNAYDWAAERADEWYDSMRGL